LLEVLFVDLDVGQIIFLLANKEAKVYPALVSEQINKKTLSGTEISYVIMLPDNEATCVELSKIDAEVFKSIEDARSEMVERATRQINKILEYAQSISDRFKDHIQNDDEDLSFDEDENIADENSENKNIVKVNLGDGVVGNLDVNSIPV
tara:strand:+ start:16017 stop:16466 length:450 start_codon:yes stop_codon:yes gene_type:complete